MQICHFKAMNILLIALLACLECCAGWVEVKKSCPDGCELRGNCNIEEGRCECPYGWSGPACEYLLISACRTGASDTAVPMYGTNTPKSCECYKQLRNLLCIAKTAVCYSFAMDHWGEILCFERNGLPPEEQFSDPPGPQENVTWFKAPGPPPWFLGEIPAPDKVTFGRYSQKEVLPMSQCPNRCHDRGVCLDRESPYCLCTKSFKGLSCGEPWEEWACLNKCSGRGTCLAGFCHCQAGWFGMDCSRSKAWSPDPATAVEVNNLAYSRSQLRIYRYEMPWNVSFPLQGQDGESVYEKLYSAFERFFEQFSSDWSVRTENPYEANLYYIPLLSFYRDNNAGNVHEFTKRAMTYIQTTYPLFWNRHQGKDHFFWLPGDLGACWLLDVPALQNPIKIVHFGLQVKRENFTTMPGRDYAKDAKINPQYSCFKLEKDVVAPPYVDDASLEISLAEATYEKALAGQQRPHLLFFGGSIRDAQPEYSGGVRQAFHKHHIHGKDHSGIIKFGGGPAEFREATFCLVPYGDGWGSRLPHAILGACIPVIIQDHVHQPFDDLLPYWEFAVRLSKHDVPHLVHILKAIPAVQIQRYREGCYRHYKAFYWLKGGLAYNHTLQSLQRKLYNLHGLHYR